MRIVIPGERGDRQKGAALLLVLWTFVVLSVLAAEFARAMRREAQSTRTFKEETLGHYLAFAGVNEAILAIATYNGDLDPDDDNSDTGDDGDDASTDDDDLLNEEDDGLSLIRALIEGRGEWQEASFNGAAYELRVFDLRGRISLNVDNFEASVYEGILENLGFEEDVSSIVAHSILDWRDGNDAMSHPDDGAEDDYYRGLDRPYYCKDAPFETVDELLLVRGVTREMYYGAEGVPGLRDIFVTGKGARNITLSAVSDDVQYALCGPPDDPEDDNGLGAPDADRDASINDCAAELGVGVRGGGNRRPKITWARIEARVKDLTGRVVSHVGARVLFDDEFKLTRWDDVVFDDEG